MKYGFVTGLLSFVSLYRKRSRKPNEQTANKPQCLPRPPLLHGRTGWAESFFVGSGSVIVTNHKPKISQVYIALSKYYINCTMGPDRSKRGVYCLQLCIHMRAFAIGSFCFTQLY